MNVGELIEEIPKRYPGSLLEQLEEGRLIKCLQIRFENDWMVSLGYGALHNCSIHHRPYEDPLLGTTVEVAIFKPSGDWFIAEGMSIGPDGKSGILSWQRAEEVFEILDYVQGKE